MQVVEGKEREGGGEGQYISDYTVAAAAVVVVVLCGVVEMDQSVCGAGMCMAWGRVEGSVWCGKENIMEVVVDGLEKWRSRGSVNTDCGTIGCGVVGVY